MWAEGVVTGQRRGGGRALTHTVLRTFSIGTGALPWPVRVLEPSPSSTPFYATSWVDSCSFSEARQEGAGQFMT